MALSWLWGVLTISFCYKKYVNYKFTYFFFILFPHLSKETNTPFENSNNTKSANTNNNNNIFGSEGDNLNDNEDVNDIFSSKPAQVAPVKRVKPTIPKAISQNLKEVKQEKPNPFAPKFKKKKEFLFNEFENELDDDDIYKKDGSENIFESSSGTKTKSIFD